MATISPKVRRLVERRDHYRCAYCLTSRLISGAQMHIEHIILLAHGGESSLENLCLSCAWCNSYKGSRTRGSDPVTGETTPLFNPRLQKWQDHFEWSDDGVHVQGLTAIGRTTVAVLQMNNEYIVPARSYWHLAGWHPPVLID